MSGKEKAGLTADAIRKAIEEHKPSSLTGLAHSLGYKGSVSSWLSRKFQALVPDIDYLLKRTAEPAKGGDKAKAVGPKADKKAKGKAAKDAKSKPAKAKPDAKPKGKWPHHERSGYRQGSCYDTAFSILAAHPQGLPKARLVDLLARATGKAPKLAAYDAQVVCSARGAAGEGLNPFEGPRHRSAKFGYWVAREGENVRLVLPDGAAKERP
jgi:hypothetical protein